MCVGERARGRIIKSAGSDDVGLKRASLESGSHKNATSYDP